MTCSLIWAVKLAFHDIEGHNIEAIAQHSFQVVGFSTPD
jgi:hypothetical protein